MKKFRASKGNKKTVPPREGPVVIIVPRPGYNPYGNEVAKSVLPKIVRKKVEPQETGEFGLPPGVKMSAYLSRAL